MDVTYQALHGYNVQAAVVAIEDSAHMTLAIDTLDKGLYTDRGDLYQIRGVEMLFFTHYELFIC